MRQLVTLQPLVAAVAATELPRLVDDLHRVDEMVRGRFVVHHEDIHPDGKGTPSLGERLRRQLRAQVERSSRAIARGHLHGEDLADAHALRADALGQLSELDSALRDAECAVQLAPASPRAWLARSKAFWLRGDFSRAAADASRALHLDANPFDAYLQRGQARFYEGRHELAVEDFARAATRAEDETQRALALLWQGWSLRRLGRPLPADLHNGPSARPWPRPALALVTGTMSPAELLAEAQRTAGDARELAMVEVWFALGQQHLVDGRRVEAREAFHHARAAGITRYTEHAAAGFELQRLGR
jgi:lipoprotein NlpI